MTDVLPIVVRCAVYADLALAFGMAAQPGWVRSGAAISPVRGVLGGLAVAGLLLSALALATLVAGMTGSGLLAVDGAMLRMVLTETAVGWAFVVRFAALTVACVLMLPRGVPSAGRLRGYVLMSGIALGTVAWTGHAVMDEGARGWLHLGADLLHLLAAGSWIGAIGAFLAMLVWPNSRDRLRAALTGFAATGSRLVALLVATGLLNGWLMLGGGGIGTLATTLYGRLLLVKLTLFGGMLAIAARNRWRLTPRLGLPGAERALARSLTAELMLALLVLALVSWLGMIAPE